MTAGSYIEALKAKNFAEAAIIVKQATPATLPELLGTEIDEPVLFYLYRNSATEGSVELMRLLLEQGASVEVTDKNKVPLLVKVALQHSFTNSDIEMISLLIEHAKEVDIITPRGQTALQIFAHCSAATEAHLKMATLLLEKGANPDHEDDDGLTPRIECDPEMNPKSPINTLIHQAMAVYAKSDPQRELNEGPARFISEKPGHGR